MTALSFDTAHHRPHPLGTIFIFTVERLAGVAVGGRGGSAGDFEQKSSSRNQTEVVGQVKQNEFE